MTKRKRFFLNGLMLTSVGLCIRTANLFFNAYVSRTVGAEAIGLFTLILSLYGFASTFATAGLHLTVTKLVASSAEKKDSEQTAGVIRSALFYATIFGGISFLVLFCLATPFGTYVLRDERSVRCIRILSLSLLPSAFFTVFAGYFVGIQKVTGNSVIQILCQIFKIGSILLCIERAVKGGVESACILLASVSASTDFIAFLLCWIQFICNRKGAILTTEKFPKKSMTRSVFGMAIPLAVSAYVRSALLTFEHMLIPKRLEKFGESPSSALSSYGILHGMTLPMLLYPMTTLTSFSSLLVPEFSAMSSADNKTRMHRVTEKAFAYTLIYSFCVATVLFLFSNSLGTCLYKSKAAGEYLRYLAPVVPIMYLDHVTDCILKGIGEQVFSMWVNIADSVLSIFMVWILIPTLGLKGYALIIVGMELFNFSLSFLRLCGKIRVRIPWISGLAVPGTAVVFSSFVMKKAFFAGDHITSSGSLLMQIVFCVCLFVGITFLLLAFVEKIKSFQLCFLKKKQKKAKKQH